MSCALPNAKAKYLYNEKVAEELTRVFPSRLPAVKHHSNPISPILRWIALQVSKCPPPAGWLHCTDHFGKELWIQENTPCQPRREHPFKDHFTQLTNAVSNHDLAVKKAKMGELKSLLLEDLAAASANWRPGVETEEKGGHGYWIHRITQETTNTHPLAAFRFLLGIHYHLGCVLSPQHLASPSKAATSDASTVSTPLSEARSASVAGRPNVKVPAVAQNAKTGINGCWNHSRAKLNIGYHAVNGRTFSNKLPVSPVCVSRTPCLTPRPFTPSPQSPIPRCTKSVDNFHYSRSDRSYPRSMSSLSCRGDSRVLDAGFQEFVEKDIGDDGLQPVSRRHQDAASSECSECSLESAAASILTYRYVEPDRAVTSLLVSSARGKLAEKTKHDGGIQPKRRLPSNSTSTASTGKPRSHQVRSKDEIPSRFQNLPGKSSSAIHGRSVSPTGSNSSHGFTEPLPLPRIDSEVRCGRLNVYSVKTSPPFRVSTRLPIQRKPLQQERSSPLGNRGRIGGSRNKLDQAESEVLIRRTGRTHSAVFPPERK